MKDQLIHTKLQRPSVAPDIVPRDRLSNLLDEGNQRALTLISAPAGYGKSTLASRWIANCDSMSAWVSLDENDNNLRVFLSYFLAAIQSLFPDMERKTETLLAASPMPSVAVLSCQLVNDINRITQPFVLVIDDYHLILEPDVHDLLTALLNHPSHHMRLILVTRHDPPLPLARLRGRGQLTEIRADDLRFTPSEVAAFLTGKLGIPMNDATAKTLDKKTEGWATGLRLAGLYLRGRKDIDQVVEHLSGSSQHIADYLAEEVFTGLGTEMVDFLVETSILDRFCVPLCQAIHQKSAGGDGNGVEPFIRWLNETNLFIIALDDQARWFRYHHLFQDFLSNELRKRRSEDRIRRLHLAAGEWFEKNGLIDEAIRHALAAGDTRTATRVVLDQRHAMMNTCRFHRLSHWLAMLPKRVLDEEPLLVTTRAFLALNSGGAADFFALTDLAEYMLTAIPSEDPARKILQGEVAVLQSVAGSIVGKAAEILSTGQIALDLLPGQALFVKSLVFGTMAIGRQMQGNLDQGVDLLKEALRMPGISEEIRHRILFYICLVHFLDTHSSAVLQWGGKAWELEADFTPNHTRGGLRYFMGAMCYVRNSLAEAKHHLLAVLENSAITNPSYVTQACGLLAFIALAQAAPDEAQTAMEFNAENEWRIQDPNLPEMHKSFQVEILLRQGKVDAARQMGTDVNFDTIPLIWFLYVPQLTAIKLLIAEDTESALITACARLEEMDTQMAHIHRKNVRIGVLALLALVYHKQQREPEAMQALGTALNLAEPGGWLRSFMDLGAAMHRLLERFCSVHPDHVYAGQVLKAFPPPTQPDVAVEPTAKPPGLMEMQTADTTLTPREIEILPLLAEGLSNKEIAEKLFVAQVTIKTHLQNIYRKLDARGRIDALKKARRLCIYQDD